MKMVPFITTIFLHLGCYVLAFLNILSSLIISIREKNRDGYPPLYGPMEKSIGFFLSRRVPDCWANPICGVPGPEIVVKQGVMQKLNYRYTDEKRKCINLASYNYLGFGENRGRCMDFAIKAIHKYGLSMGATRQRYGTTDIHVELEKLTAEFVGAEDSLACGIGFTTNSLQLPMLMSEGCLALSDEKNHASLIVGIKVSGATVKVFRHNDVAHLELLLKEAIYNGRNKEKGSYEPWKKILIIVEGLYSMEGTVTPLPEIIALKKRFKAYLYIDEAHSIGVMGKNGRGVVEYFGCNPKDVDILMGTYTKSFGGSGGYIAGDKTLISYMRSQSYASQHLSAMSPPIAAHIVDVLKVLMGKDGTNLGHTRISTLARNSKYFRRRLHQIGVIVKGSEDSPVVPIICYFHSKTTAMVRLLLEKNIACVGVMYPITSILECRLRLCLSAANTREQLDYALKTISEVVDHVGLKYSRLPHSNEPVQY